MTITGDKTEETPITLSEAIGEVAALPRCAQHALLTAGAAMVDACTIKAGHR